MPKNCKVALTDTIAGRTWTKEGDFGLAVIADRVGEQIGNIEVDFGSSSERDLAFLVATVIKVLHDYSPKAAQYAIVLFSQRILAERKAKDGLISNKQTPGRADDDSPRKN